MSLSVSSNSTPHFPLSVSPFIKDAPLGKSAFTQDSTYLSPIQPLHSTHLIAEASKVDTATKSFWEAFSQHSISEYLGALIPLIMTIIALVDFVKDFIIFVKACCLGLGKDVGEYIQKCIMDLLRVVSSILAPLHFILNLAGVLPKLFTTLAPIISGVFSLVCLVWELVRDLIGLNQTKKAFNKMEEILEQDIDVQEKTKEILRYFEGEISEHKQHYNAVFTRKPELCCQDTQIFMDEQLDKEMENRWGTRAYAKVKEGIAALVEAEQHPQAMLKAIEAVRETREYLAEKSTTHWISIAASVFSIAAVILTLICPPLGAALTVTSVIIYVCWTISVVCWITNGVRSYQEKSSYNETEKIDAVLEKRDGRLEMDGDSLHVLSSVRSEDPLVNAFEMEMEMINSNRFNVDPNVRRKEISEILLNAKKLSEYQAFLAAEISNLIDNPPNNEFSIIKGVVKKSSTLQKSADETAENFEARKRRIQNLAKITLPECRAALRREYIQSHWDGNSNYTPLSV